MKVWTAPSGDFLVQRSESDLRGLVRFVTPGGALLEVSKSFVLVDSSGEPKREFDFTMTSVQEVLSYDAYDVSGSELRRLTCSWTDSQFGEEPPDVSETVVMDGLVPVQDSDALTFLKDLEERVEAARAQRQAAMERVRAQNLEGRLRAPEELPPIEGEGPLDFVLDEVGSDIVLKVAEAAGELRHDFYLSRWSPQEREAARELWRESIYGSGRRRPDQIEEVVRARYGTRVRSFVSRVEYGD